MLEADGNKHEFLPFMDRMSWFERVGLEYLAKQHMTDDEMKEMKDKLQSIKDHVIERAFGCLQSKIVEIDTMVTTLQQKQMRGNTKLLKESNASIRKLRRQLLRIQNESSGKYRNQRTLLMKLSRMRRAINLKTGEQIASCVCGEELFAMSVQECNYSDSWWCSHCCETYYKHDMLYHCENGKKCIYNELMQYIYDLCQHCWTRLRRREDPNIDANVSNDLVMKELDDEMFLKLEDEEIDRAHLMIRKRLWASLSILENAINDAHSKILDLDLDIEPVEDTIESTESEKAQSSHRDSKRISKRESKRNSGGNSVGPTARNPTKSTKRNSMGGAIATTSTSISPQQSRTTDATPAVAVRVGTVGTVCPPCSGHSVRRRNGKRQSAIQFANKGSDEHLEVMDKLAKRICNFETQFVKR